MNAQMQITAPEPVTPALFVSGMAATDSVRCYREKEKTRIVAALQADSSLLVVSAPGLGKSALAQFVADELQQAGFAVALVTPLTPKQTLIALATQLGAATTQDDGRQCTSTQLQEVITETLHAVTTFIICDDAHRLPVSLRLWLEQLMAHGQRLLLFATYPPRKDIFLKLPRIELGVNPTLILLANLLFGARG